jgi:hypothetical protein
VVAEQAPDSGAVITLSAEHEPQTLQHAVVATPDAGRSVPSPSSAAFPAAMTRLRVTEIDLWSVVLTGALVSFGTGVAVAVAGCLSWAMINAVSSGQPGPSPMWGLTLLTVTVLVAVVLGTALTAMIAFLYNVVAQHTGGIQLTLRRQAARPPGTVGVRAVSWERLRLRLPLRLGLRRGPAA